MQFLIQHSTFNIFPLFTFIPGFIIIPPKMSKSPRQFTTSLDGVTPQRAVFVLLSALLVLCLSIILYAFNAHKPVAPSVRAEIERQRGVTHSRILELSRANTPQIAKIRLNELRRDVIALQRGSKILRSQRSESESSLSTTLAIDDLNSDLERLRLAAISWRAIMEDATLTPVARTELMLQSVIDTELHRWPKQWVPTTPSPQFRIVITTRLAILGICDGLFAPIRPLWMARLLDRSLYKPRNILFPYKFPPNWLYALGYIIATILAGYLLCWVSMKWVHPWISYIGLLYFVAALVFFTGFTLIHVGILK